MNVIAEIEKRLQKYPHARYEINTHSITVFPLDASGFTVSLLGESHYSVNFDSWHEEFDDADAALNCLAFGLSVDCRLKVWLRGNFEYAWTVEEKDENGDWAECTWIGCSTTGLLIPPLFWLKKSVIYRQNHLIKAVDAS